MLTRQQLFPLNYYKKTKFNGSMGKMNLRLEKAERETGDGEKETLFTGTVWKGPYCYDASDKETFVTEEFPFTEEGICAAADWFNEEGKKYV